MFISWQPPVSNRQENILISVFQFTSHALFAFSSHDAIQGCHMKIQVSAGYFSEQNEMYEFTPGAEDKSASQSVSGYHSITNYFLCISNSSICFLSW